MIILLKELEAPMIKSQPVVKVENSYALDTETWKSKFYETLENDPKGTAAWTKELKQVVAGSDYLKKSEEEFLTHFRKGEFARLTLQCIIFLK